MIRNLFTFIITVAIPMNIFAQQDMLSKKDRKTDVTEWPVLKTYNVCVKPYCDYSAKLVG